MSETLNAPLTVREARRRLANTRGLSSAEVAQLEQIVTVFHSARPRDRACAACSCMRWAEHETADGGSAWACAACHRSASLTPEAWRAAKREAAAARQTVAEAAAAEAEPDPGDALQAAIATRAAAATALDALEAATLTALSALSAAQGRHADAVAGMRAAEQTAIECAAGQRTARSSDVPVDARAR